VQERCEQRPVRWSEPNPGTAELSLQYADLMPYSQDLDILVTVSHREQAKQSERVGQTEMGQPQQPADHPALVIADHLN
jgi:hypothetical protein